MLWFNLSSTEIVTRCLIHSLYILQYCSCIHSRVLHSRLQTDPVTSLYWCQMCYLAAAAAAAEVPVLLCHLAL